MPVITIDDVRAAAARIEGVAHRTPVLTSTEVDRMTGRTVLFKAEHLQRVGAFKFRGALNALASLPEDALRRGVVAYSSGNHAQAVALAARLLGTTATIVMPADAPAAKREATAGYGAEVVLYDRYAESREDIATALAEERGLSVVPPFDDPAVMAGQGTAALELIEDAGPLDALVVPVSGGGLIAGSATAAKALLSGVRVIGVEPEGADDTARSFAAGERVAVPVPRTIADGLGAPMPGELTFEVNRRLVDEVVVVPETAIRAAMRVHFERMKQVIEPSGAVGLAALLEGLIGTTGRIGVIVSGGNVDAARFADLIG